MLGEHRGFAPLWLFEHQTPLTAAADGVRSLVDAVGSGSELERLHRLMDIAEKVMYLGATHTARLPRNRWGRAAACARITRTLSPAARLMGFPGRYVSGYLMMDGAVQQAASHAWAEAHVPGLGWVGFGSVQRHVTGRAPTSGWRRARLSRRHAGANPLGMGGGTACGVDQRGKQ